jgi:ATP phosphoribosyltransferase regulatory subunit
VSIYRGLVSALGLADDDERELFNLLQSKAVADIDALVSAMDLTDEAKAIFSQLPRLYGEASVLDKAGLLFGHVCQEVTDAIEYLRSLAKAVSERFPQVTLYFDLAELRGYEYHTGVVFAALTPAFGQAIAKGGRYDDIGKVFGRARPATGFSADLKVLSELSEVLCIESDAIAMPVEATLTNEQRQSLWQVQSKLRLEGERLVAQLAHSAASKECSRQLVWQNNAWKIVPAE